LRRLCKEDLFFLLTVACKRKDADRDWIYDRCREVEREPDGYIDLWSREHYKSTVITFALNIQEILNNPEVTIGIFSHTRPIAKAFLAQIKREFETNTFLQNLFPEILYKDPKKESPKWSLDEGIIVKRKGNPKESTVEAWGLVDGQPTSKHYQILNYDDVVSRESVTTPEMIEKVTQAWELSLNLTSEGGKKRIIGTRYHQNDTYASIIARGSVKQRIYPATDDGTLGGRPVLWDLEYFQERVRDLGSYVSSCHCSGTKVLMSDWSYRSIEDIKTGDTVVGFIIGNGSNRLSLVESKVVGVNSRIADARRYDLASGNYVECTPDHKWWTGRSGSDSHKKYSSIGDLKRNNVKSLQRISYIEDELVGSKRDAAKYFSGLFDGEGSVSTTRRGNGKGSLSIHQSHEHNPEVCERIEKVLSILCIPYRKYFRKAFSTSSKNSKASTIYTILGGRPVKHRLLQWCGFAKSKNIIKSLYGGPGRYNANKGDKVVGFSELGKREVFNIQTETGNYIANGYASKNCQLLQNPLADNAMGFREEWIEFYDVLRNSGKWNFYLLCDPASEKKKDSDYTSMAVIGLAPDNNYYLVDGVRDRMNLTERTEKLFQFHKDWNPVSVGYEKYGMQSDIEHIRYVQQQNGYRFKITELGGSMPKNDRIRRLVPLFENHRFYFPRRLTFISYEKKVVDLVREVIDFEYIPFPVAAHDDFMDCLSRICDPDLKAMFPKRTDGYALSHPVLEDTVKYDPLEIRVHSRGGRMREPRKRVDVFNNNPLSMRELLTRR